MAFPTTGWSIRSAARYARQLGPRRCVTMPIQRVYRRVMQRVVAPEIARAMAEIVDARDARDARNAHDAREGSPTGDDGGIGQRTLAAFERHYLADLRTATDADDADRTIRDWAGRAVREPAIAWDPFPAAVRSLWLLTVHLAHRSGEARRLLPVHERALRRCLERDIGVNHVLIERIALLGLAVALDAPDRRIGRLTAKLERELRFQIEPDGAHFEMCPAYHLEILFALDVLGRVLGTRPADEVTSARTVVDQHRSAMLAWLASIMAPDRSLPTVGDFPLPPELERHHLDLLGVHPAPRPHADGALRVLRSGSDVHCVVRVRYPPHPAGPFHLHADPAAVWLWYRGEWLLSAPVARHYQQPALRGVERSTGVHFTLAPVDEPVAEFPHRFATLTDVRGAPPSAALEAHVAETVTTSPSGTVHRRRVTLDAAQLVVDDEVEVDDDDATFVLSVPTPGRIGAANDDGVHVVTGGRSALGVLTTARHGARVRTTTVRELPAELDRRVLTTTVAVRRSGGVRTVVSW